MSAPCTRSRTSHRHGLIPTGKVFAGWTTNGSNLYAPNENIVLSQNTILYPVYRDTVSTCEITYNDARDQQEWKVTVNAGDSVYIDLNGGTEAYLDGVRIAVSGSYTGHALLHADVRLQGQRRSLWAGIMTRQEPASQPDGRFPMSRSPIMTMIMRASWKRRLPMAAL